MHLQGYKLRMRDTNFELNNENEVDAIEIKANFFYNWILAHPKYAVAYSLRRRIETGGAKWPRVSRSKH